MVATTVAWTIICELLFLFQCSTRFDAIWGSLKGRQQYCNNANPRFIGFAVTDVLADLILLIIPMPLVGSLGRNNLYIADNAIGMGFTNAYSTENCCIWNIASGHAVIILSLPSQY